MKTPIELDRIADVVLAYRPKIKTKAGKRRARRNKRAAKVTDKTKIKGVNYIIPKKNA